MLRFKKCDKKFPPNGKWKQGWKWAPGPRTQGGAAARWPGTVTWSPPPSWPARSPRQHHAARSSAAGPADVTMDTQHRPVMTLPARNVFHHSDYIASYVSNVTCQVDKYAVSRPQLQDNSCRSQLFIGYWCMEAWRGPRVCDWPSGKQMLTCRYCHWARQSTISLFQESS